MIEVYHFSPPCKIDVSGYENYSDAFAETLFGKLNPNAAKTLGTDMEYDFPSESSKFHKNLLILPNGDAVYRVIPKKEHKKLNGSMLLIKPGDVIPIGTGNFEESSPEFVTDLIVRN